MTIQYRLSEKAKEDYFSIYAYSFEQFGEAQAEEYTNGLLDIFNLITEQTKIGKNINYLREGYFCYTYKSHAIYYKLDDEGILIIRVLGQRQKTPTKDTI